MPSYLPTAQPGKGGTELSEAWPQVPREGLQADVGSELDRER